MLMTKTAYARNKGVSRQTVYDWIKKGELVLVGAKIDVEATTQRQSEGVSEPLRDIDWNRKVNISQRACLNSDNGPEDTLYAPFTVTASEAAAMVLTLDDLYPPAGNYEALQMRVQDAAEVLGLELRFIEVEGNDKYIDGLEFYDPEQDCIACHFDSPLFELEALTFFRWLIIAENLGSLNGATKAGLAALAVPFITDAKTVYEERAEQ